MRRWSLVCLVALLTLSFLHEIQANEPDAFIERLNKGEAFEVSTTCVNYSGTDSGAEDFLIVKLHEDGTCRNPTHELTQTLRQVLVEKYFMRQISSITPIMGCYSRYAMAFRGCDGTVMTVGFLITFKSYSP